MVQPEDRIVRGCGESSHVAFFAADVGMWISTVFFSKMVVG